MAPAQTRPCVASSLVSFLHSFCQTSCNFLLQEMGVTGQSNYFLKIKECIPRLYLEMAILLFICSPRMF